jgi:hypothetical protein
LSSWYPTLAPEKRRKDGAPNLFSDPAVESFELELMHHADYGLHILDRRSGHDAVAEVEDVAGASVGGAQDFMNALL